MISRRLTEIQKTQIVEDYRTGENTNLLAEKYGCTTNTINRTVKTLLSESEYKLLKEKRLKNSNKKVDSFKNSFKKKGKEDLLNSNSLDSSKIKVNEDIKSLNVNKDKSNSAIELNTFLPIESSGEFIEVPSSETFSNEKNYIDKSNDSKNNFEEIPPLLSNFDFDNEKQKSDFKILNYESLPESVYMIVDKKVELELLPISSFPEWSFLPENELKRNAILLFNNQRSAKRSCSRNQRVIKIPNTSIFKISKTYLISKGITRLILDDSIIGLDT